MAKAERPLRTLEKSLQALRSQARRARGEAGKQLARLERQARTALAQALRKAEPKVRKAVSEAQAVGRGVRAGVKAGVAAYRESGRGR